MIRSEKSVTTYKTMVVNRTLIIMGKLVLVLLIKCINHSNITGERSIPVAYVFLTQNSLGSRVIRELVTIQYAVTIETMAKS